MPSILELLQEQAGPGVPFKTIDELFDLKTGYTPSKANGEFWSEGSVPWFRMEDIRTNGRVLDDSLQKVTLKAIKGNKLFPQNSILIATSATIGEHALVTVPHLSNQRFTNLYPKEEFKGLLDMKFAFYYSFLLADWCKNNTTISSFASVDMAGLRRYKFALPPLETQKAIVEVLDRFTELEFELEKEIVARKKQFEYYRNLLLSPKSTTLMRVEKLFELRNGYTPSKANDVFWTDGSVPWFRIEDIRTNGRVLSDSIQKVTPEAVKGKGPFPSDSLIVSTLATIGEHALIKTPFIANQQLTVMTLRPEYSGILDMKFAFYLSYNLAEWCKQNTRLASFPSVDMEGFKQYEFSVPEMGLQLEIVAILDSFSDLIRSLEAELSERRKQFKYYRDHLLTFTEIDAA